MDVVTAAGLDSLGAPWLWALPVFPLAAPALVELVLMECSVTGRWWWASVLQPGLGLAGLCLGLATVMEGQALLAQLIHQLHRPFT